MDAPGRRLAPLVVACASAIAGLTASESPQQAFAKSWEGQSVVVRQTLYSLVYNERGRLGKINSAKRDGLTVVTPSQGIYFQFDGRQGRDDVAGRDPQRILDDVSVAYQPDGLDVRAFRKIEPLLVARYDAGAELVVRTVRIDGDIVRLGFAQPTGPDADDLVTSLTIKWPAPLAKSFPERPLIENLIRRFVDLKPATVRN